MATKELEWARTDLVNVQNLTNTFPLQSNTAAGGATQVYAVGATKTNDFLQGTHLLILGEINRLHVGSCSKR